MESKEEVKEEEPAPPEPPKKVFDVEFVEDEVADTRPKVTYTTELDELSADVTCLVQGKVVSAAAGGELSYVLSGARATSGILSGRYVFEVLVQDEVPADGYNTLRIGVGVEGSSNIPGSDVKSCAFDTSGRWWSNGKSRPCGKLKNPVKPGDVLALLVNCSPTSEQKNTISIFHNG